MTYLHAHIPTPDTPPKFGAGERVIIVPTHYDEHLNLMYAPGERGTVKFTGPPMRCRPVVVLLDSTGEDATIFEDRLAPEPDTP